MNNSDFLYDENIAPIYKCKFKKIFQLFTGFLQLKKEEKRQK